MDDQAVRRSNAPPLGRAESGSADQHLFDRESFAKAVAAFGSMTTHVDLLAEFAHGDQAMLLYDMEVEGLGTMRVAEHFRIGHGQITRIRQIHDTAALRAAGFGETA